MVYNGRRVNKGEVLIQRRHTGKEDKTKLDEIIALFDGTIFILSFEKKEYVVLSSKLDNINSIKSWIKEERL